MALLVRRNGSLLPSLTSSIFDSGKFFGPGLFDFDGDLPEDISNVPSVNISENEKEFTLELAAPGLARNDFKVEVENRTLTISAEKEEEKKEEKENYKRREFSYSGFCRSFELPENILSDKIDAKYENGILRLSLPKKEVSISKPAKQIKVA